MIPSTFEEALLEIKNILAKKKPLSIREEIEFGRYIRNSWMLWDQDSSLHIHLKNRFELWHADDMYRLIYKSAQNELDGKSANAEEQADQYKRYWESTNNSWPDPNDERLF